jgi:hypothetical protein
MHEPRQLKPISGLGEELWNIYVRGRVWDGDVLSKRTKAALIKQGLATCKDGYTTLTPKGLSLLNCADLYEAPR